MTSYCVVAGTLTSLRVFVILLISFLVLPSAWSQTVRIRIHASQDSVEVTGQNLKLEGREFAPFRVARAHSHWILSTGEKILSKSLVIHGENLRVGGVKAPSPLTLLSEEKSNINAIVSLPLEDYIVGVVSGEMPSSWPMDALMAQAVAARSYMLAQLANQGRRLFDTDASHTHQVFKWTSDQNRPAFKRIQEAVRRTQGMVLTDAQGRPFWAYYHADCGGQTEEPNEVWHNHQLNGTVREARCSLNPKAKWKAEVPLTTLSQKLKTLAPKKNKIIGLEMGEETRSGRVKNLILKLDDGSQKVVKGNEFRQHLGFDWIKSTMFGMSQRGSIYHFAGQGYGHGVGLCQWGSREQALQGKNFLAILKTYYPQAKIERGLVLP